MFGERQNNLDVTVFIILKETEDVTILNTEFLQTADKIHEFELVLSITTRFEYFL